MVGRRGVSALALRAPRYRTGPPRVVPSPTNPEGEYMRHALHRRGGLIAGLVAVALVTLFALPAVSSAATKTDKTQNKRIAKQAKSIKKLGSGLKLVTTNLGKIDTRLKTIENAAPAIVSGLNALKDGLTKLQTLGTSTEYIVAQVKVGGTALPGCFLTTPDVPDNANKVMTTVNCVTPPGSPLTGAVTVLAACRSSESDGTDSAHPCAQAGIVAMSAETDPTAGGAPTFTGFLASVPNAAIGGAPLYDIPLKSPPFSTTATSFPLALIASDNTVDLTTGGNSTGAVLSSVSPTTLSIIHLTLRAFDDTPDATDPSA